MVGMSELYAIGNPTWNNIPYFRVVLARATWKETLSVTVGVGLSFDSTILCVLFLWYMLYTIYELVAPKPYAASPPPPRTSLLLECSSVPLKFKSPPSF
jgi:hypothetical protein